jgi:hypothetical protein
VLAALPIILLPLTLLVRVRLVRPLRGHAGFKLVSNPFQTCFEDLLLRLAPGEPPPAGRRSSNTAPQPALFAMLAEKLSTCPMI